MMATPCNDYYHFLYYQICGIFGGDVQHSENKKTMAVSPLLHQSHEGE